MKESNTYSVYMHISPSGKRYIGITKQPVKRRWGQGYRHNSYFTNAINKYGWDNFEHLVVASGLSKDAACRMEIDLITKYKSNQRAFGYNESSGGEHSGTGVGHIVSEETRQKMRDSHLGKISGMSGKHQTNESKEKNRQAHLGKHHSEETKKKLSLAHSGKSVSDSTREKLSKKLTGRKLSEEHKAKLSLAKKGKPSPRKGQTLSEETRNKISESLRRMWM